MNKASQIVIGVFIILVLGMTLAITLSPTHLISDRKELCESLGGKYGYEWSDYWDRYEESCERVYRFIDLDQ